MSAIIMGGFNGIRCILRVFKRMLKVPIVLGTLVFVLDGQADGDLHFCCGNYGRKEGGCVVE